MLAMMIHLDTRIEVRGSSGCDQGAGTESTHRLCHQQNYLLR